MVNMKLTYTRIRRVSQKTYSNTESINGTVQQVAVTLRSVESILSKLKPHKTPLGEAPLPDSNAIRAAAFHRRELSKEEVVELDMALVKMDAKTTAEEVNDLLARGACPNLIALPVNTRPLFTAARLRRHDLVRALLTFGAYPNLSARYPEEKPEDLEIYPIHLAAINRDATTANLLLRSGADINALTPSKQTALQLAALCGSDGLDVLRLLLSNGAEPNAIGCPPLSALHIAIHLGESDAVSALLEAEADPNHNPTPVDLGAVSNLDTLDQPPLHAAIGYCAKYSRDIARFKIVELLVQHGADITLPAVFSDPSTKHIKEDMNALAWLAYLVPQGDLRSQLERILHGTRGNIREGIYCRDKDPSYAC
jgi:ankyrin repeat protein